MRAEGVGSALPAVPDGAEGKRLRQVAQDFEAIILSQMLASMRAAAGKGVLGGKGQQLYQQMMDDELGRVLARSGGLGLADVLMRDLVRQTATPKKVSSSGAEEPMSPPSGGAASGRSEGDFQ
jgi:Rod binding domain-containing protein